MEMSGPCRPGRRWRSRRGWSARVPSRPALALLDPVAQRVLQHRAEPSLALTLTPRKEQHMWRRAIRTVVLVTMACAGISAASEPARTVSPTQALDKLKRGNERYVAGNPVNTNPRPFGGYQTPIAAVVSCSDARVPVETVLD